MLSIFLLIPLSLMLFVVAIWAVRYAVKSNQFEDLDNASQRIILDDRQERRQTIQAHERTELIQQDSHTAVTDKVDDEINHADIESTALSDTDKNSTI